MITVVFNFPKRAFEFIRQMAAKSALCEFMHGAANVGVVLNPPLVTDAAKVRKEPIPTELLLSSERRLWRTENDSFT